MKFMAMLFVALIAPFTAFGQSTLPADLHAQINASCPILGVSIGTPSDKATWSFQPAPGATAGQVSAGQSVITTFDLTPYTAVPLRRQKLRERLYDARHTLDAMNEELSNDPGNAAIQAEATKQQAFVALLRALAKQ